VFSLLLAACPSENEDIASSFSLNIEYDSDSDTLPWDTSTQIKDLTHDIYVFASYTCLYNVYRGVKANQTVNCRVAITERGRPAVSVIAYKDGVAKAEAYSYIDVKNGSNGTFRIEMKQLKPPNRPGGDDGSRPDGGGGLEGDDGSRPDGDGGLEGDDDSQPDGDGDSATQTPTADDFTFGNLAQAAGSVTHVTVTPKPGKSGGAITRYYEGTSPVTAKSTTLPTAAGTYAVTFDVAAAGDWRAATGLSAGTLTVYPAGTNIISVNSSNWSSLSSLITPSGNAANPSYYVVNIAGDITSQPDDGFNFPTGAGLNLTINGGGSTIDYTATSNGILLCSFTGQTITMNNLNVKRQGGIGATVSISGGTFIMNNCTITGGTTNSGGVYVASGGTFTMNGGTISGLTNAGNNSSGGGVCVIGSGSTFNMLGGEIFGNAVPNGYGGGVAVLSGSTFRIVNGTIYGNSAGELSNTARDGDALCSVGTAQYGTFATPGDTNSTWIGTNIIASGSDLDDTLEVVNGNKIRP